VNSSMAQKDFLFEHTRDLPYFRGLLRAVESHFYQDISFPEPILDLGCGDGHFAQITFENKINVGLDPWTRPIHEARTRGVYNLLSEAYGSDMPFPPGYFSSALSNSVLEHIPNLDEVLIETARVLKPGAIFVFCVPNEKFLPTLGSARFLDRIGLKSLAAAYRRFFNSISRHHTCDSIEQWQVRLDRTGFAVEKAWNYFSPASFRVLEVGHFLGLPSLLIHFFTRKWHISNQRWNFRLLLSLLDKYYKEPIAHDDGVYTFYIARRK